MILGYNLQFFAQEGPGGEKTEPATEKKLRDARKEGQVAKSKEIANGLCLLALFVLLKAWIGNIGTGLGELFSGVYDRIPSLAVMPNGTTPSGNLYAMLSFAIMRIIVIAGPVFLVGFVVAFISDVMQVKWYPTMKPLQPKLSRLNPISGFKRIFSANSIAELVKSIAKIILIAWVAWSYIKKRYELFFALPQMPLGTALTGIGELVIGLGIQISAIYMILALADYAYQKWKFNNDMKMTKQEIKEEYKEQEGDPQIKGKQKQRMQEASRRRMMQQLPEADVVITNPTHYAVAIKYDSQLYPAPVVIAKGEDYLAQKIKEVAKEHKIEIVENKPLARMLYANVDIGAQIPPELYEAVANVLAYVYQLQGKL